jgi:hypothetical protein
MVLRIQVFKNDITENNKIYITARQWNYLLLHDTITLWTPTHINGAEPDIDNNQMLLSNSYLLNSSNAVSPQRQSSWEWRSIHMNNVFKFYKDPDHISNTCPNTFMFGFFDPQETWKTAILNIIQFITHKYTNAELHVFITSALDVVANFMLQPLYFW